MWIPILTILLVYLGSVYLLSSVLGNIPFLSRKEPEFVHFLVYVGSFLIAIGYSAVLKIGWEFHIPPFKLEPWKPNPRLIVGGVILMLASSIVLAPVMELLPNKYLDDLNDYLQAGFWPMATAVLAAPLLEEFLFRGIIQKNLENRLGPLWGIVLGALIFGGIHAIPQQVIYASLLGLILGSIYYLTGSLTSVIAIHFVNNGLTALLYMFFGTSADLEKRIFGTGMVWMAVYVFSALLLLGWGWYVVRRVRQDESQKRAAESKSERKTPSEEK